MAQGLAKSPKSRGLCSRALARAQWRQWMALLLKLLRGFLTPVVGFVCVLRLEEFVIPLGGIEQYMLSVYKTEAGLRCFSFFVSFEAELMSFATWMDELCPIEQGCLETEIHRSASVRVQGGSMLHLLGKDPSIFVRGSSPSGATSASARWRNLKSSLRWRS